VIRLAIRRPVAVAMVYLSVGLLGVAAWTNLPLELLPDASFPRLSVTLQWLGASPETVEARATAPMEAAIQRIPGVERITSTTREGEASIQVEFHRDVDMDFVRLELTERIGGLEDELPDGLRPPVVTPYVPQEFETEASQPFLHYSFTGPLVLEALRLHLEDEVIPALLRIEGVQEVVVEGGRQRLLEVELDPDAVESLGLQPGSVVAALSELDLVREAGAIRSGDAEWAVTIRTRPADLRELRESLLPGEWATPIRVDDVAVVRDTFEEPSSYFRINGSPAVSFQVVNARGTNVVRLADRVKERIDAMEGRHPAGSEMVLNLDQSERIRTQLWDLRNRAAVAAVVIFFVLFAFLRSVRSAAIVFATIAFSILIALNLVYFSGLSLNLLTLMGLALGFGLIVDNSIVVLENIYRRWQGGEAPAVAAEEGAREVVLPILASTATTCIVFLPFLYLQGELRIYYLPLAVVVGLTLLASIFVAFTFIPALAARILPGQLHDHSPVGDASSVAGQGAWERGAPTHGATAPGGRGARSTVRRLPTYDGARPPLYVRFYAGLLEGTLRAPWVTVLVAGACFAGGWWLFTNHVTTQAVWGGGAGAQRSYIQVGVTLPRGADLDRVDHFLREFEDRVGRMPEVDHFMSRVQGTSGSLMVYFPEELEFTAVPLIIEEQLRAFALGFSGVTIRVLGMGPAFGTGGGGTAPNYRITLLGYNYERLAEIAEDLGARLERNARIEEVDTNATAGFTRDQASEFVARIDREAVERHQVTVAEVAGLLNASLRGGERAGFLMMGEEAVRYEVKLAGFLEADVQSLSERIVTTSRGAQLPLGDLIRVEERRVLTTIRREDQQYERTVAYEFRGPRQLGDLVRDEALATTVLPPGYAIEERTPWRISSQEEEQMLLVLLVAIGLVFMVTAALFESIRQPAVVLLAVPMALIGVFLIFFYTGASFTREARIGIIMMGGIVVNNAILLVDQVNRTRARGGLPLVDAIVRGTLDRVRPILMTTATTVLGLLPLVLFTRAADATIWNALTYALIGGLLSSTLFVLVTTPSLYLLVERGRAPEGGRAS
jgi:hydrophobic/amphiphilic exporter-1 (mainly G- bacteria), HAE1 family